MPTHRGRVYLKNKKAPHVYQAAQSALTTFKKKLLRMRGHFRPASVEEPQNGPYHLQSRKRVLQQQQNKLWREIDETRNKLRELKKEMSKVQSDLGRIYQRENTLAEEEHPDYQWLRDWAERERRGRRSFSGWMYRG